MTQEEILKRLRSERRLRSRTLKKLHRARREIRRMRNRKAVRLFDSFMKVLVLIVVLHGLGCVTTSYVFAWYGVMEPLKSLSETIAREIVAPVVVYGMTKTIENVSKYNDWLEKSLEAKYLGETMEEIPEKVPEGGLG